MRLLTEQSQVLVLVLVMVASELELVLVLELVAAESELSVKKLADAHMAFSLRLIALMPSQSK
jgi:hypothetical protein